MWNILNAMQHDVRKKPTKITSKNTASTRNMNTIFTRKSEIILKKISFSKELIFQDLLLLSDVGWQDSLLLYESLLMRLSF